MYWITVRHYICHWNGRRLTNSVRPGSIQNSYPNPLNVVPVLTVPREIVVLVQGSVFRGATPWLLTISLLLGWDRSIIHHGKVIWAWLKGGHVWGAYMKGSLQNLCWKTQYKFLISELKFTDYSRRRSISGVTKYRFTFTILLRFISSWYLWQFPLVKQEKMQSIVVPIVRIRREWSRRHSCLRLGQGRCWLHHPRNGWWTEPTSRRWRCHICHSR